MKYLYSIISFLILSICARGQNVSSPYSALGVGDIDNSMYGRYGATSGAAVSRRDYENYNFSNPASLTSMGYHSVYLDFSTNGRYSRFKIPGTDTFTGTSKDIVIKQAALAFNASPKTAFAFGLKPFSSVNYQYTSLGNITDGNFSYTKITKGDGGLNQIYASTGTQVGKHLSIGFTGSWLFGSLQQEIEYINPTYNLDIIKSEKKFYTAAGLMAGVQYYTKPGKIWQHTFGLTAAAYSNLNGTDFTNYSNGTTGLDTVSTTIKGLKLPLIFSAGYTALNKNGFSFNLQGNYQKWSSQSLAYTNSYTSDAYSVAAGVEYSKKVVVSNTIFEKYYVGLGGKMERSYMMINNNHLDDYSFVLGAGTNISWLLGLNGSVGYGLRGQSSLNQIKENYLHFSIGITVRDVWFMKRKYGL
jgi:hypothetical protein